MYKRMNWNVRRIIKIYLFTTFWSITAWVLLLVSEEGGSWSSKHPELLSPSKALPCPKVGLQQHPCLPGMLPWIWGPA